VGSKASPSLILSFSQWYGESATTPSTTVACPSGSSRTIDAHYANRTGWYRGSASEDWSFVHTFPPSTLALSPLRETRLNIRSSPAAECVGIPICMYLTVKVKPWILAEIQVTLVSFTLLSPHAALTRTSQKSSGKRQIHLGVCGIMCDILTEVVL